MMRREGGLMSWYSAASACVGANLRYWLTVAPRVRIEMRRWRRLARLVPDRELRVHALEKLCDERANTEGIATLCTLAPLRHRAAAVEAVVALQVMYDYLDAVTEQTVQEPVLNARQLYRAFAVALTPGEASPDYYRHHPQQEDGGYLDALIASTRIAVAELPASAAVRPVVRLAAARFGEAQTLSHAVPHQGPHELEEWALRSAAGSSLRWWEWAGGAAASVLAVHALLAAAADARTTGALARQIDRAYLLGSTLATMLDSLVDDDRDSAEGAHRYIAYYRSDDEASCRIAALARAAIAAARSLPRSGHHVMTVSGLAAFYLSGPGAGDKRVREVSLPVLRELRPLVGPIRLLLRIWRSLA